MKGSQNNKIKSVMNGSFSNMIGNDTNNRMKGTIAGAVIGLVVGGIFRSNPIYTALIGGIIGFISRKE